MFAKKDLTYRRSSWHYSLWCWTYQNYCWHVYDVPDEKSICAYWQRILWIGLFTALAYLTFGILKLVIYDIAYRPFETVGLGPWISALILWVLATAVVWLTGLTGLPSAISFAIVFSILAVLVLAAIVRSVIGLTKVLTPYIVPTLEFDAWFIENHLLPGYKPRRRDFWEGVPRYESWPMWRRHLTFWPQFLGLYGLTYLLCAIFVDQGKAVSWALLGLATVVILTWVITALVLTRKMAEERTLKLAVQRAVPESPKKPSRSQKESRPGWFSRAFGPIWTYLVALKDHACPLVKFVD